MYFVEAHCKGKIVEVDWDNPCEDLVTAAKHRKKRQIEEAVMNDDYYQEKADELADHLCDLTTDDNIPDLVVNVKNNTYRVGEYCWDGKTWEKVIRDGKVLQLWST